MDVKSAGFISAKNGHTSTLRIYLGGVKLVESTLTMPTALTMLLMTYILILHALEKI